MWAGVLLAVSPLVFAQDAAPQSKPPLPPDVLGPQLVAWSQLQKPRPVPQPLPPPDQPSQQQSPAPPAGSQAQPAQQPEPPAQAFTGMIVKNGGKYVLKMSDGSTYQIDDQEKARPYEAKQVKIAGSLDVKTNLLHVVSIELVS
jgi:hypothetical protein